MSSNIEKVKKTFEAMSKDLDVAAVSTHWADDYKAQILPESLGLKEMNKEEHLAQATKLVGNIKEYSKFELVEIFESGNKVTGHLRSNAILKDGTEHKSDAIFIVTFNDEGKVVHFKQFIDSLAFSQVAAKLMA
ncbi:hypothetical protein DL96DRAFT_1607033 [Flagelloscypha sp. PMI_526]|nr:hypothetical protein DL96DRAFT_1607033 [Flagelloscypha sp. PMI_526]